MVFVDDDEEKPRGGKGGAARGDDGKFKSGAGKGDPPEDDEDEEDDAEVEEGEDGSVTIRTREPGTPSPRKQRRAQRYEDLEMRNRQAEFERDHYKNMAQLALSQQQSQQSRQEVPDPEAKRLRETLDDLEERKNDLWALFLAKGTKITPDEKKRFEDRARKLDGQIRDAHADLRDHSRGVSRGNQQGNGMTPRAVASAVMAAEYPDVTQDPRAWQYAKSVHGMMEARGESVTDLASIRKIMDQARTFKQNGYRDAAPKPSPERRRQYSGRPSSHGQSAPADGATRFTDEEKRHILKIHGKPGEPPNVTLAKYAKKSGKRLEEIKARA